MTASKSLYRRRALAAGIVLALAPLAPAAWAQSLSPPPVVQDLAPPRWSVGAGAGQPLFGYYPNSGVILGAGVGGLTSYRLWAPLTYSLQIETRISASVWLTLGGQAGHGSATSSAPVSSSNGFADNPVLNSTGALTTYGATGGARYVANPNGEVEIGAYAAVGATRATASTTSIRTNPGQGPGGTPITTRREEFASAVTVGGEAGLTFERAFTRNLALRLSSSLVSVASSSSRQMITPEVGDSQEVTGSDFNAGFTLAPRFELRILF